MRRRLGAALALVAVLVLPACAEVGDLGGGTENALLVGDSLSGLKLIGVASGYVRSVAIPGLKNVSIFGSFITNRRIVVTQMQAPSNGDSTSQVYAVPLSLDRPGRLLGKADQVFPSLTPGNVWLDWKQKQGDEWEHLLREVDVNARQISLRKIDLGRDLIAPVEGGFLTYLNVYDENEPSGPGYYGGSQYLELWDPATDKTLRRIENDDEVIAESRRLAAFHQSAPIPGNPRIPGPPGGEKMPACGFRCPVHLVDLRTGQDRQVPLPAGVEGEQADAVFSPDGRNLAVTVQRFQDDGSFVGSLLIIDTRSGRIQKIPNTDTLEYLGPWSPDGRWLFFSPYPKLGEPGRIGAYRLGNPAAKTLRVKVDHFSSILVIPQAHVK